MNGRSLLAFLRRDQWPSGSKPLDGESPPDRISVRARGHILSPLLAPALPAAKSHSR